MKILGIDSTSKILSVAVSEKYLLRSEIIDKDGLKHMANIINNVDNALKEAKIDIKDIDMFTANLGPGDFTGTRIGLSIIKMLAKISNKKIYGIGAIESSLVSNILNNYAYVLSKLKSGFKVYVLTLMDVRNKQIYYSLYNIDKKMEHKKELLKNGRNFYIQDLFVSLVAGDNLEQSDKIFERISDQIIGYGDGDYFLRKLLMLSGNFFINYPEMDKGLENTIKDKCKGFDFFTDRSSTFTKASVLNYISYIKYMDNIPSLPAFPIYVRDFVSFKKQ
jgi:tRNA threonylcarbamoyl adenosine modification protein YeaZ